MVAGATVAPLPEGAPAPETVAEGAAAAVTAAVAAEARPSRRSSVHLSTMCHICSTEPTVRKLTMSAAAMLRRPV